MSDRYQGHFTPAQERRIRAILDRLRALEAKQGSNNVTATRRIILSEESLEVTNEDLAAHKADKANPHTVVASQVAIEDVGGNFAAIQVEAALAEEADARQAHEARIDNPHAVTAAQVGAYTTGQADALLADKVDDSEKGAPLGVATLDASGDIPMAQLPEAALGGLDYQGTWDASTNTPTLASGMGTRGHFYKVSVAGATPIDGVSDWAPADWIIFDGVTWQKVDNSETVTSVAGRTGNVTLSEADITDLDKYSQAEVNNLLAAKAAAFIELDDVPAGYATHAGKLLAVKATEDGLEFVAAGGGGGAANFTDLGDVPAAYTGHASKVVSVKADETGLEFTTPSGGGGGVSTTVLSKSADYTVLSGDNGAIIEVDATAGPVVITLPAGLSAGYQVLVMKIDTSSNLVTLAAGVGATLLGGDTLSNTQAAASIYNRGADAWMTIGGQSESPYEDLQFSFNADGEAYMVARVGMRISSGLEVTPGGATIAYAISTDNGATFTSPIPFFQRDMNAGDIIRITATGVTTFAAVALPRIA